MIKVMSCISQKQFPPFRESKLTRVLQAELKENCTITLIGTITPYMHIQDTSQDESSSSPKEFSINSTTCDNMAEIIKTLNFVTCAKVAQNLNENKENLKCKKEMSVISEMKKEIDLLKSILVQNNNEKNVSKDNETQVNILNKPKLNREEISNSEQFLSKTLNSNENEDENQKMAHLSSKCKTSIEEGRKVNPNISSYY